jgi:hypothetical protein
MTIETAVVKRESVATVVPLNEISIADVGRDAAKFDAWLQEISGGYVTLDRIKNVAGALPVVGNIMALVDVLNDIAVLSKSETRDPLDWVSLGIDLIGVIPVPANMAAARMSLRPTLYLVRQEMKVAGKTLLGDALINVIVGHLNATIVGDIDDFVRTAKATLPDILEKSAQKGEEILNDIAMGLNAVVNADLNATENLNQAEKKISGVGGQLLHDPTKGISNIYGALCDVYKAAGKGVINSAAKYLLPKDAKKLVHDQTRLLTAMGPELRTQLKKLSDPSMPFSIGALLAVLAKAVEAWNLRNGRGIAGHVKVGGTSQAKHRLGEGRTEVR